MKEINLRDFHPFYTSDVIVEAPDEAADLLHEYKLAEAAYILRTYRHKAYFFLDYDANVERDALVIVLTPTEILEQKEANDRLYQALASLPEKQRNRTIEKIIKLLRCAFKQAVRWELIGKNPFGHAILPKTEYKKAVNPWM